MSLASQLQRLQAPVTGGAAQEGQNSRKKQNVRASVMYTPREAADVSLDQIHEAALVGYAELCSVDPLLEAFDSALFSPSARQINRELCDKETNAALDVDIGAFTRALSPYLLLSCVPPVLEYLVRRFEVHLYNVQSMLECVLPFHETPIFSRVLAILALDKDVRFRFLRRGQRSLEPLPRHVIVDAITGNLALVDFIWDMGRRIVGGDSAKLVTTSEAAAKSTLTFCSVVIVEFLRRASAGEGGHGGERIVRRILPHVLNACKFRRSPAFQSMGCMAAMQLCRSFPVSSSVFESIVVAITETLVVSTAGFKSSKNAHKRKKHKKARTEDKDHSTRQPMLVTGLPGVLQNTVACVACIYASCKPHAPRQGLRIPHTVLHILRNVKIDIGTSASGNIADLLLNLFRAGKVSVMPLAEQLVLQLVEELANEKSQNGNGDLSAIVKKIATSMPCSHLVHPVIKHASESTLGRKPMLFEIARSFAAAYPEEVDMAVSQLVSQASIKQRESDENTTTAPVILENIMEIFSGTRHCPVDDTGTTLYLALKHPSPAVRISGIKALQDKDRKEQAENGSFDESYESATEARFIFDSMFSLLAGEEEAAVVSHAANYIGNTYFWLKISSGFAEAGRDPGMGDLAVIATCKALERWSYSGSDFEYNTLMVGLLGVAESIFKWFGDTIHSFDASEEGNQWMDAARPLYNKIVAFLPTPFNVLESGKNAPFSPIGAKAVVCAAVAGRNKLTDAFMDFSVDNIQTRCDVVSCLAKNIRKAADHGNLEQVYLDLWSDSSGVLSLCVVAQAIEECVRSDTGFGQHSHATKSGGIMKNIAPHSKRLPSSLPEKLLELSLSLWSLAFWTESKLSPFAVFETQIVNFLLKCINTLISTCKSPAKYTPAGILDSFKSAWECFQTAKIREHMESSPAAPILLLLMLMSSPKSKSRDTLISVQTILSAHFSDPSERLCILSLINRQTNHHRSRHNNLGSMEKQPSWCIASRAMSLELSGLYLKSFTLSSIAHGGQKLKVTGDTIASILIALQSESSVIRKASVRCLRALRELASSNSSSKYSIVSAPNSRLPPPSQETLSDFCETLLKYSTEMCTDRFYVRQAVSRFIKGEGEKPKRNQKDKVKVKGGDTTLGQWLLSECAAQMTYHDPDAAIGIYRIFESLPPLAMIESAGTPLIVPALPTLGGSSDTNSSEPLLSRLPLHAGEVVRIVVSQYQILSSDPSSFSAAAYEVLRTLLCSSRVLQDITSVPYSVREDAMAAITPDLCALLTQEQSDELFHILFVLRVIGYSGLSSSSVTLADSISGISNDDHGVRSGALVQSAMKALKVSSGVILDFASMVAREASNTGGAEDNFQTFDTWLAHVTVLAEVIEAKSQVSSADMIAFKLIDCLDQLISASKDGVNCADETTRSQHEFASTLLLVCALKLYKQTKFSDGRKKNPEEHDKSIRLVKVVVRCIKWTVSSQVRNAGLLLLAHLSERKSAAVLECLVPVFSFVGKGLATAREDNYTFTVVRRILKTVVPALPEGNLHGVLGVFVDAFDSIMPHRRLELFKAVVNSMKNRGPDLLSWVATAFISGSLKKSLYGTTNTKDGIDVNIDGKTNISTSLEMMHCCHDLCSSFKLSEQARMIATVLAAATGDYNDDGEEGGEDDHESYRPPVSLLSTLPILVETNSDAGANGILSTVKTNLLKFVYSHLDTKGFVRRLMQLQQAVRRRSASTSSSSGSSRTLAALLEQQRIIERCFLSSYAGILRKLHTIASSTSEKEIKSNDNEGDQEDEMHLHGILGSLVSMLTVPTFLAVLTELLRNGSAAIRLRALQLLNTKVVEDADDLMDHEIALFLDLVDELYSMAFPKHAISDSGTSSESSIATIQAALYSLNFLATAFAENHPDNFVSMLSPLTKMLSPHAEGGLKIDAGHDALRSTVFCTLATLCIKLGPRVIPTIPVLVPTLVSDLDRSLSKRTSSGASTSLSQTASLLLRGALTSLAQVIAHIPAFVKSYVGSIYRVLLRQSSVNVLSSRPQDQNVAENIIKLTYSRSEIEPRVLLPIIFDLRGHLVKDSNSSEVTVSSDADAEYSLHPLASTLVRLYDLLRNVILRMDAKTVRLHYNNVFRFIIDGCKHLPTLPLNGEAAVRTALVAVVVELVLRLSERRMRPMFLEAVEFARALGKDASVSGECMSRRAFLYELVGALSERLKSIFCPFFGHVVADMSRDLTVWLHQRYGEEEQHGDGRSGVQGGRKKKRRKRESGGISVSGLEINDAEYRHFALIKLLTRGLCKCFMFDNAASLANVDGYVPFMTKGRFDILVEPLCDLLGAADNVPSGREKYEAFMDEIFEPCIAYFAATCPDDLTRKTLHNKLLMQTRSDLAHVRARSIMVLKACFDQVGEDYLFLVPETLPFMAELLEDSDGRVERLAHELKKQVEELSGEGLDTYLVGE